MFLFKSKSSNFATESSILVVAGVLDPALFFFSSTEVRLNECLTTCHPEWFLRKIINCSILHRFSRLMPTLAHWPGESRNCHVFCALISSCKIFRPYDNSPAVGLFHVIVIAFSLFIIIFTTILTEKRDIDWKYRQETVFCYFVKSFRS